MDRLLGEIFLQAHAEAATEIVLDLDSTDDPLHGQQEGRFFHGYYGHYCYLPLYIFCGEELLCARLRPADIDGAGGVEELERIVQQIRQAWPEVRIIVRGDSGFCREELMRWCEENGVDYVLGLAKNDRLKGRSRRAAHKRRPNISRRGKRRGYSRSSTIKRGTVGRERGGWWPRPNIWRRAPIRGLW